MDPACLVLHYGLRQAIFEGLKAYRQPDGTVSSFRPLANAAQLRSSTHPIDEHLIEMAGSSGELPY